MTKIKTCCFFGNNVSRIYNLENSARWTIETHILENNVRKFIFGSGGEFEEYCYRIVKSCQTKFPPIVCEVIPCCNLNDIKKIIDLCDFCVFESTTVIPKIYKCEGIEIKSIVDKACFAYSYAFENNKRICYI